MGTTKVDKCIVHWGCTKWHTRPIRVLYFMENDFLFILMGPRWGMRNMLRGWFEIWFWLGLCGIWHLAWSLWRPFFNSFKHTFWEEKKTMITMLAKSSISVFKIFQWCLGFHKVLCCLNYGRAHYDGWFLEYWNNEFENIPTKMCCNHQMAKLGGKKMGGEASGGGKYWEVYNLFIPFQVFRQAFDMESGHQVKCII